METIDAPIGRFLAREALHDRILYLVLTKGLPFAFVGTRPQRDYRERRFRLDSDLPAYDGTAGVAQRRRAESVLPGHETIREAQPFSHRNHDVFLVARLDGFTVDDVFALIDRGQAPSTSGSIVLDQRSGLADVGGDLWLEEAAARLRDLGHATGWCWKPRPGGARRGIRPRLLLLGLERPAEPGQAFRCAVRAGRSLVDVREHRCTNLPGPPDGLEAGRRQRGKGQLVRRFTRSHSPAI